MRGSPPSTPESSRPLARLSQAMLVAAFLVMGTSGGAPDAAPEDALFYRFVDTAAEAYSRIQSDYCEEVEPRRVFEGAINGMFRKLDRFSSYMAPDMMRQAEEEEVQICRRTGLHLTRREGALEVVGIVSDSPAVGSGLQRGDHIIAIDGETTKEWTPSEAVAALRGPAGTHVKLSVVRQPGADPMEFDVERKNVEIRLAYSAMQNESVGYIRLSQFGEGSADEVRAAVLQLKSQGMKGLILDLRFNGGGLLNECAGIAELFLPRGKMITYTKGRTHSSFSEYESGKAPLVEVPLFVLVNNGSASASEMLAGALRDHGVAVLVAPAGEKTFGKGSVQEVGQLQNTLSDDENGNPRNSGIRVTVALYYLPSGVTIHQKGLEPDLPIEIPQGHEAELQKHGLLGDIPDPSVGDEPFDDIVLRESTRQMTVLLIMKDRRANQVDNAVLDFMRMVDKHRQTPSEK